MYQNLLKKQEVRNRISKTVKKIHKEYRKKNLPYGFQVGENNYSAKSVTKLYEECFKAYSGLCFVCGKKTKQNKSSTKIHIHHLNKIHQDDRIENIAPCCNSCHQKLHRWWKGWVLTLKTDIDYGHHIPDHKGKCFYSHGHTAIIKVKFEGLIKKDGMVADFKDLKKIIKDVTEPLDHSYLNELEQNPSVENIAPFIFNQLEVALHFMRIKHKHIIWLKQLEMSEGLNKSVIIE